MHNGIEQDSELGQLIHDLRTAAGLSQRELAERMGTTQSVVSRLEEGGGTRNRLDTFERLARALGRHLVVAFPHDRASQPSSATPSSSCSRSLLRRGGLLVPPGVRVRLPPRAPAADQGKRGSLQGGGRAHSAQFIASSSTPRGLLCLSTSRTRAPILVADAVTQPAGATSMMVDQTVRPLRQGGCDDGGVVDGRSSAGWTALRAADWAAAQDAFAGEVATGGGADALDGLARSHWWRSAIPEAVAAWERAYVAYREAGRDTEASRVALWLSKEHGLTLRNHAVARGWLARARRLLEPLPPGPERGWLRMAEAELEGDPHAALDLAGAALELGRRTRDPDLELAALGRVGLAEIWLGRVDEGVSRFEEAMAAITAGEAHDLRTVGDLYCSMILAGEATLEPERFAQWNQVLFAYLERAQHPDVLTFCGTCCAEICKARGQWVAGEKWLTDTLAALEASGQHSRCVHPATRLASLRVLQGRLEEAEALLLGYEDLPEATLPMVTLHLANGQTALAAARLLRRLNQMGRDSLPAVPLLLELADIQAGRRDLDDARVTAGQLVALAEASGLQRVQADSELALGLVALGAGDVEAGAAHLSAAIAHATAQHLPHRAARAHLALARGLADVDRDAAVTEARQARDGFDALGATRDADIAAGLLRDLGVAGRTGPKLLGELSKRELEVLRLLGYGLTNAEIAARLYISTRTVDTHVGNVFAKLHVRNRAEAATFAQRFLADEVQA